MTVSPGAAGQRPAVSLSGLKRGTDGSIPKPNEGAPCVLIALPCLSRIFVADRSPTEPDATSTPASARTVSTNDDGTEGGGAVLPEKLMSADLPVMTASVLAYDSV